MKKLLFGFLLITLLLVSCKNPENNDDGDSRKELILATIHSTQTLQRQVYDFNKSNSDYYITLKEYMGSFNRGTSSDELAEMLMDARLRLDADIVASNRRDKISPDIIVLSLYEHLRYARKGYFEDLGTYFDGDNYVSVFDAIKLDGKLHGIFPYFRLDAILKRNIPDDGDLFDTLVSLQNEAEYSIMGQFSRMGDFSVWMMFFIDEFIDWENGECEFNNPRFKKIVEMLKDRPDISYPDSFDDFSIMFEEMREAMKDNPFFIPVPITNIYALQGWMNIHGKDAVYTSFPGNENMLAVYIDEVYAIPKNSKNKGVAWEFINGLIDEEYQMKNTREIPWFPGIPVLWEAVEFMIANSQNESNTVLEWWQWIGDQRHEVSFVEPGLPEVFRSLLEKEFWIFKGGGMTSQIIMEEIEYYFNDVKTLERVIEILNNRMGLYLKENM